MLLNIMNFDTSTIMRVKLKREDAWKALQLQQQQLQQQAGSAPSLAIEIEKLVKLRDSGALTQEEFEISKRGVLGKFE